MHPLILNCMMNETQKSFMGFVAFIKRSKKTSLWLKTNDMYYKTAWVVVNKVSECDLVWNFHYSESHGHI